MESVVNNIKYCSAGLPTSNALVELISRDFDISLKSKLHKYGLIFYSRYIDDSLLIFNRLLEENKILECIEISIKEIFKNSNITLNKSKTFYLTSDSVTGTKFAYLGYLFEYKREINTIFQYGIANDKLHKHRKKLLKIINDYKNKGNMELFRQRLLFWASRIVFYNTLRNQYSIKTVWDVGGIVSTYGELRYFLHQKDKIVITVAI